MSQNIESFSSMESLEGYCVNARKAYVQKVNDENQRRIFEQIIRGFDPSGPPPLSPSHSPSRVVCRPIYNYFGVFQGNECRAE